MIRLVYDLALFFLGLCMLPKLLWQRVLKGKYKGTLFHRLGFFLPPKCEGRVIWIHAVSLGEAKSAALFIKKLKKRFPHHTFVMSCITQTGLSEAKKHPHIDQIFYLPLDFRPIMKRLVRHIAPEFFFLVETDFWLNQLLEIKKRGGKTFLVSGKISDRSFRRLSKYSRYCKSLFDSFTHFCVQNRTYQERFSSLGVAEERMSITGNFKFDRLVNSLSNEEHALLQKRLSLEDTSRVITVGSTHTGEEEILLDALQPLLSQRIKILLVPRHPERFDEVALLLKKKGWVFDRFSQKKEAEAQLVLVDEIGILTLLYQISTLAIVGGSFVPGIGGHNILEPISHSVPCLFGPYMESQRELVSHVLSKGAGQEVPVEDLEKELHKLFAEKGSYEKLKSSACHLRKGSEEIAKQTLESCALCLL